MKKWICEYRELIRKATKIVHEWNGHLEILIRPQPRENFKAIFASPNRYFTQNSSWVLLYALQTERGRFFMTLSERTCMNSSDMGLLIVSSSGSSALKREISLAKFNWYFLYPEAFLSLNDFEIFKSFDNWRFCSLRHRRGNEKRTWKRGKYLVG